MKAERHKLARQAGGGFWLSAPKPFNKIGVTMGNISETILFEDLQEREEDDCSIKITITVGTEEYKKKILDVLEDAEISGELAIPFDVMVEY
jgi:hypothetical protein